MNPTVHGSTAASAQIDFRQPSPFLHPRTVRATVVVLLALLAALLHFPRLRHAAGQALLGWLFVAVMAILFGAAGALIALAVSLAAVYRPAPRKSGR